MNEQQLIEAIKQPVITDRTRLAVQYFLVENANLVSVARTSSDKSDHLFAAYFGRETGWVSVSEVGAFEAWLADRAVGTIQ